jgi:hypothetical protein
MRDRVGRTVGLSAGTMGREARWRLLAGPVRVVTELLPAPASRVGPGLTREG